MMSIITELVYIFLRGQLKDASGCGSFSLHWRPIVGFRLLSAQWSGCCRFDTFPISFLNFLFFTNVNLCVSYDLNPNTSLLNIFKKSTKICQDVLEPQSRIRNKYYIVNIRFKLHHTKFTIFVCPFGRHISSFVFRS